MENYKFLCKCVYNLLSPTNLVCCNSNINLILIWFSINRECKFSFVALFQMLLWIILWSLRNVVSREVFFEFLLAILFKDFNYCQNFIFFLPSIENFAIISCLWCFHSIWNNATKPTLLTHSLDVNPMLIWVIIYSNSSS